MKRWWLYHVLTFQDVLRLWPTVQHHVIIVAGICLPILLLLGLKNGHVADLREDLLKSPTGRQVVFWSGQQGELMTPVVVRSYEREIPGVEIVIPEIQRLVSLTATHDQGNEHYVDNVTLYSTRPGDPILAQYGGDVLRKDGDGIVLMSSVSEALDVQPGDAVEVTVERERDGAVETASVSLEVRAVIEQGSNEKSSVGYADVETLCAMEQYVMGFQVRRFGWPALKAPAPDRYSSYLIFCEETSPLKEEDLRTFNERGYVVEPVRDEELRTLYGLLRSDSLAKLLVYRLAAEADEGWRALNLAPGQLARLTAADDIAIPWNEPTPVTIAGNDRLLLGLSLPQRTWLRLYMKNRQLGFDFNADTFSIQLTGPDATNDAIELRSRDGAKIPLAATRVALAESDGVTRNSDESSDVTEKRTIHDDGKTESANRNVPREDLKLEDEQRSALKRMAGELDDDLEGQPVSPADSAALGKEDASQEEPRGDLELNRKPTVPSEDGTEGESVDGGSPPKGPESPPPQQHDTAIATDAISKQPGETGNKDEHEATADTENEEPPGTDAGDGSHSRQKVADQDKPQIDHNASRPASAPSEDVPKTVADDDHAHTRTSSGKTPELQQQPEAKSQIESEPAETDVDLQDQDDSPATDTPPVSPQNGPTDSQTPEAGEGIDHDERQSITSKGSPLAVVPMDLLAYVHAEASGSVEYDAINRLFVAVPQETLFDKARLYANTIDRVPSVVDHLRQRGFAIMSEVTRIREIHQQDHSLQLLVVIVGVGAFLFGTVTVVSVLLDSTERKRGTIGILRVMGVSRLGVFYMVFLRAAIIGVLAAAVTVGVGLVAAMFFNWQPAERLPWAQWKPIIHIIIQPRDMLVVVVGSLACCTVGSIIPARKASGMDPFDAIVEGRFR